MRELRDLIGSRYSDGRTVVVFPSQVAADAWAVEILKMTDGGAVDPDRLIGWDRFKEGFISPRRDYRPANRVTRTLWAALVVARQAEEPFLARILGSGRPSASFVGFLASVPPALASIARAIGEKRETTDSGSGTRGDPLFEDLLVLYGDYRAFMASRRLFEPSWELPKNVDLERPHLLVAPELVEDWEEWRGVLDSAASFETLPLPSPTAGTPLLSYENAWEEYRDVCLRIATLIDSGVSPEDIGITVADLDGARPWLEEAAAKAGIPLVVRRGMPLAASPFGRLVAAIGAAADSGFGLPAMKSLLLDRFATWKETTTANGLIRFGIEHHAFASWTRDGKTVDVWEESLGAKGKTSLRSWYRLLRRAALDITGARNFRELGGAVAAFRNQFLDESGWEEDERRLVERSMDGLAVLSRAEEDYARGARLPSPFALWLATLRSERYVPQRRGSFVQAYPWRVSALLPFKYHFLLGCGFDAVEVRYGGENFLREDQKDALGRPGRDATEDFLRAYLLSGDLVIPCHAAEEIGGWSAPHPFFARAAADCDLPRSAPDPLALEAKAWRGEGPLPGALLAAQKRAFLAFDVAGPSRQTETAFDPLDTKALAHILPRLERNGRLRLSHTLLAEYRACPFRWLVERALRVEEESLDLGFFDALLAGTMAHRAIQRLFEDMRRLGPVEPRHLEVYRRLAAEAPASILDEFARDKGPFLEPMFEAWSPLLADRLRRLVENLVEDPGWEIGELEIAKELEIPERGLLLEGRIDRLARRGDEIAVVDYKKNRMPAEKDIVLGTAAEASELADTQIASYLTLVESGGEVVTRASFWSIEGAKARVVVGDGGLRPTGGYGPELASFRLLLFRAADGIRGGRFAWTPPSSPACANCGAKAICRSHYSAGR